MDRERLRDWLVIGWIFAQITGLLLREHGRRRRARELSEFWGAMAGSEEVES